METTVHRQLKELYAGKTCRSEVRLGAYRIDAISRGKLIEVQQSSLSAIRHKIADLVSSHPVVVVKPIVLRNFLTYRDSSAGPITSQRYSPKRGQLRDIFLELVHFVKVFPHPNLTIELVLIEQTEERIRRKTRRGPGFRVVDKQLTLISSRLRLKSAKDLLQFAPQNLPPEFSTADLATLGKMPRWLAQKMAYCWRECGAVEMTGKRSREMLYRLAVKPAVKRQQKNAA